ncbi:hypothetical protein GKC30_08345 [Pseudodesulfovibrio sp. F-1]|uniref:Uncharacterized protein n=1 Tax=Pseudodesulfovibrio alkaliphilus TaxID=2661613 RepID=A0A7K1KNR3_9BACT|nr:hypothetical protein [Pseudodesulfovibrio alkaliphilus]MUM77640.1 hypothetical protein [Pseudodesulfovibrio alkaliphilus]
MTFRSHKQRLRLLTAWLVLALLVPSGPAAGREAPLADIPTKGSGRPTAVLLHGVDAPDGRTRELGSALALGLGDPDSVMAVILGSPERGDDHFHARFEALRTAWGDDSPVAVVADGESAFAFVRKYREDLFAQASVFYCGMSAPAPEYLLQCGDCTGLAEAEDVAATVELLFRLRPRTRLVVGIADGSAEAAQRMLAAKAAMTEAQTVDAYETARAGMIFPGHEPGDDQGLTLAGLRGAAHGVPASGGAVLFLGFASDAQGEPVDEAEAVAMFAARSAGPVFGLTERHLGAGVACVVTVPARDLGHALAGLILRAQAGEPVREMLPEPLSPRPVIDMATLARFGVQAANLPQNALVLNEVDRPDETAEALPVGLGMATLAVAGLAGLYLLLRRLASR